jgi:hypothetical protein
MRLSLASLVQQPLNWALTYGRNAGQRPKSLGDLALRRASGCGIGCERWDGAPGGSVSSGSGHTPDRCPPRSCRARTRLGCDRLSRSSLSRGGLGCGSAGRGVLHQGSCGPDLVDGGFDALPAPESSLELAQLLPFLPCSACELSLQPAEAPAKALASGHRLSLSPRGGSGLVLGRYGGRGLAANAARRPFSFLGHCSPFVGGAVGLDVLTPCQAVRRVESITSHRGRPKPGPTPRDRESLLPR